MVLISYDWEGIYDRFHKWKLIVQVKLEGLSLSIVVEVDWDMQIDVTHDAMEYVISDVPLSPVTFKVC